MTKILLASHGELSIGMFNTVSMIAGVESMNNVETYSLVPGENALDFATDYEKNIISNPDTNFIIITDLFGGSVHTSFSQILKTENVVLLSGMNANLVLEIILRIEEFESKFEALDEIISNAKQGISSLSINTLTIDQDDEDF